MAATKKRKKAVAASAPRARPAVCAEDADIRVGLTYDNSNLTTYGM